MRDAGRGNNWYGLTTRKDLAIGRRLCLAVDRGEMDPPIGMLDNCRMCAWKQRQDVEIERAVRFCERLVEWVNETQEVVG